MPDSTGFLCGSIMSNNASDYPGHLFVVCLVAVVVGVVALPLSICDELLARQFRNEGIVVDATIHDGRQFGMLRGPRHCSLDVSFFTREPADGSILGDYVSASIGRLISGRLYRKALHDKTMRVSYLKSTPEKNVVLTDSTLRANLPWLSRIEFSLGLIVFGSVGFWVRTRRRRAPSATTPGPADCVVTFDDDFVRCRRPGGSEESVRWSHLECVIVQTTEAGPAAEDVFLILAERDRGCVVPQTAMGTEVLLARLQELPGFDNQAYIDAMGTTSEAKFECWRRSASE